VKITVEIPDSLLKNARALSRRERTTLRALIEEGLRRILAEGRKSGRFRLRDATFRGKGLHPHVQPGTWQQVRDAIYEGRGS